MSMWSYSYDYYISGDIRFSQISGTLNNRQTYVQLLVPINIFPIHTYRYDRYYTLMYLNSSYVPPNCSSCPHQSCNYFTQDSSFILLYVYEFMYRWLINTLFIHKFNYPKSPFITTTGILLKMCDTKSQQKCSKARQYKKSIAWRQY